MRPQGLLHRRHEIRIFPWQLSLIPAPGEILRPPDRWTHHLRRRRVFQALFKKFFHIEIETMLRPIQRLDPLIKNLQSLQSLTSLPIRQRGSCSIDSVKRNPKGKTSRERCESTFLAFRRQLC